MIFKDCERSADIKKADRYNNLKTRRQFDQVCCKKNCEKFLRYLSNPFRNIHLIDILANS